MIRATRVGAILTVGVLFLSLQPGFAANATFRDWKRLITAPYDVAGSSADGACFVSFDDPPDPECQESASALTDGSLTASASIQDFSGINLSGTFAVAAAEGHVTHHIVKTPPWKGAELTITLAVRVPCLLPCARRGAEATREAHAELRLVGSAVTTCHTDTPDDCTASFEQLLDEAPTGGGISYGVDKIKLTIQAPPNKPLGDGSVSLQLRALADVNRDADLLPQSGSARASSIDDVLLESIELEVTANSSGPTALDQTFSTDDEPTQTNAASTGDPLINVIEGDPGWDCATMGNRQCGPA